MYVVNIRRRTKFLQFYIGKMSFVYHLLITFNFLEEDNQKVIIFSEEILKMLFIAEHLFIDE